ncbi:MAG: hypothetical protein K8F57_05255, partial [Alphaproteobacteria bacterium]|nr:hypothetical protein [Alphaproteobacteria bacterium]
PGRPHPRGAPLAPPSRRPEVSKNRANREMRGAESMKGTDGADFHALLKFCALSGCRAVLLKN